MGKVHACFYVPCYGYLFVCVSVSLPRSACLCVSSSGPLSICSLCMIFAVYIRPALTQRKLIFKNVQSI